MWSQSASERLTVGQPAKIAGKRNDTVQTKIPVSILDGYHVNSNTPSEDYLIPLTVTWSDLGALTNPKLVFPKPSNEKYEFADKPLSVFTGKIEIAASFKVSPNAPAGPGIATGKLRYQACNNRACFPPKTVDVNVPYQVQ